MDISKTISKFPSVERVLTQMQAFSYETYAHSLRVAEIVSRMVDEITENGNMRFSEQERENMVVAACIHDIGKLSIPHEILAKPGALSDEEFGKIKQHPLAGQMRIGGLNLPKELESLSVDIALNHHRKIDGSGYPNNIDSPVSHHAQIVQVADIYEALTARRSYKDPLPREEALKMMESGQCGGLNKSLIEILQKIAKDDIVVDMREVQVVGGSVLPSSAIPLNDFIESLEDKESQTPGDCPSSINKEKHDVGDR